MTCPACKSQNEMAYSVLSNGFVCLQPDCGFELEMTREEAHALETCIELAEDLVCA